jgi:hypothetical protein
VLIPYFLNLRQQLSPDNTIKELYAKAQKKLQIKGIDLTDEVNIMENYIYSAFAFKDYETCRIGVMALGKLEYEVQKKEINKDDFESPDNISLIYDRLNYLATYTIDDPRLPKQIINTIMNIGLKGIEVNSTEIVDIAQHRLTSFALETIEKKYDYLTCDILGTIGLFIRRAGVKNTSIVESCIDNITTLGDDVIRQNLPSSIVTIVHILSNVTEDLIKQKQDNMAKRYSQELFKYIEKIPVRVFQDFVYWAICERLFMIGVLSLANNYEELKSETTSRLKNLELILGAEFIKVSLDRIPEYEKGKLSEQFAKYRELYFSGGKDDLTKN